MEVTLAEARAWLASLADGAWSVHIHDDRGEHGDGGHWRVSAIPVRCTERKPRQRHAWKPPLQGGPLRCARCGRRIERAELTSARIQSIQRANLADAEFSAAFTNWLR